MPTFPSFKIGFSILLSLLFPALPVFGNAFYDSLPENKREEIKIIDDHTIEIGIGPDNRSVSCNILDAVQSIPYVVAEGKPATVFVNKEKIFYFRNKLYTWDREGKYRVRLTTKYIRKFGNIRIHVPKEGTTLVEAVQTASPKYSSFYHQTLPQKIKEEITIIDENMVEVAIGPDDRSISTTLVHAVKSIPSVKESEEPDHVYVNYEPIYHIKEGFYAWDAEGKIPVMLTTKYVRSFGNIKIHIIEEKAISNFEDLTKPVAPKELAHSSKQETLSSKQPIENFEWVIQNENLPPENPIPSIESREPPPIVIKKPPAPLKPSSPAVPHKNIAGVVKGFRLAQFGMNEEQVIRAIEADFGLLENKVEKRSDPKSGQHLLTISSPTLEPENGKAWIHYYLSPLDQTLNRVDVIWGHPDHSIVDPAILKKSAKRFKNLFTQFRQLKIQTTDPNSDKEPYLFYGLDTLGNGIKMMWATPLDKNFQTISQSVTTLTLSYFLPQK